MKNILLSDIEAIQNGHYTFNNNVEWYGIWDNFQKALENEGCKYWGDLYKDIFEKSFVMDKEALEKRINVPPEIQKLGAAKVTSYLEQMKEHGEEILYEGKILIVGEAAAGKTTLFYKLENPQLLLPDTKSTLGVVVKEGVRLLHPEKSEVNMVANLWDFGGQEVQYNLHQYFITSDALYILVSDNRREGTKWDYWFHIIELLADKGTVLVVINNNATISSKSDFERTKYEKRFSMLEIKESEVNLSKNDDEWRFLQHKIKKMFSELSIVNYLVPKPWTELRKTLLNKRRKFNYISSNDFFDFDTQEKITPKEKESALDYFTKIGIVTYFSEDKNLNDIIFLNPNWITQGLYAAISSANETLKDGTFTRDWICNFWSKHKNKYKPGEQSHLLRLMLKDKFDICYELENKENTFVIPFLLPEKEPENIQWSEKDNLGFRVQYPFMPKGILSRLTVQLHEKIESNPETNDQLVWRDGVILKDEEHGSRAKIISVYDAQSSGLKYIDIRIIGTSSVYRKDLLQLIRNKIRGIHDKSFKGIKPTELVCCNCAKCKKSNNSYYFDMKDIEDYIKNGNTQIECRNLKGPVYVDNLIGPVYSEEEIKRMKNKENERGYSPLHFGHVEKVNVVSGNTGSNIIVDIEKSEINQDSEQNTFNFHNCNIDIRGNLNELADSLKEKGQIEEAEDLEEAVKSLSEVEECTKPEDVKTKGFMNKLKRIIKDLNDENSNLHKTVKGIKHGIGIAQDIAKGYNDIAQWCGLPQVPEPFLKKE